ncbi:Toxin higB-2 [Xanthomonas phaseoli pv. phaseoli]|uniref:Toxin higB-2 n=2 Tax=Xanthomonas TaxID=338 RepID=A0A7Z7IXM7_XANCH|nr:Toxin higB-2 [Xanthomonas phaseoli pv. phaseoli]
MYAIDVPSGNAYDAHMIFVETPIFTASVTELLTDEQYGAFQSFLIAEPRAGDVIEQTGGLRKVRWSVAGKGKRGGVRVIYYFVDEADQIRLLLIYKKGVQDDLTPSQKKVLKAIKDGWA